MPNHFLRPPYKRPEILSDRIPIRKNPGTFVWIPQKVVGHFLAVRTVIGENILEVILAVHTVVGGNILEVFVSCPHGGRGSYFGRTYPQKNDQPCFKKSTQTSRDSFESDSDFKKSRDVYPDSSNSGW